MQDPFLDNLVHISAGKSKPGVKTSLDLGKVVTFHMFFSNGIDISLRSDCNPGFSPEFGPEFFHNSLEVEHQLAIFSYILPHFVHQENYLMVFPP
ncbi:hypothetical protein DSECCO2_599310 [anaerobic digester metagenome]